MEKQILERGEVQSLQLQKGAVIRSENGVLWLTFEGESGDVLLGEAEIWSAPHRGKVVVQALKTGVFYYSHTHSFYSELQTAVKSLKRFNGSLFPKGTTKSSFTRRSIGSLRHE